MSLVVAAVSGHAAALATDSIHVDLRTGTVRTGYRKHLQVGARAAAFVGVSDSDGVEVSAWLATALSQAGRLADIADEFLTAAGVDLVGLYQRWREVIGGEAPEEEFLQIVVISTETGRGELLQLQTRVVEDALTLVGAENWAVDGAYVAVLGAVDEEVLAYTAEGRTLRLAQQLQDRPVTVPHADAWSVEAGAGQLKALVAAVVEDAVAREGRGGRVPTPPWWPAGALTIAGPVHSLGSR